MAVIWAVGVGLLVSGDLGVHGRRGSGPLFTDFFDFCCSQRPKSEKPAGRAGSASPLACLGDNERDFGQTLVEKAGLCWL